MNRIASMLRPKAASPAAAQPFAIKTPHTALRIARYLVLRAISLALMVVIVVWLSVIVMNLGGFADEIKNAQITRLVHSMFASQPAFFNQLPAERRAEAQEMVEQYREAAGLNQPFLLRSLYILKDALTFNWWNENTLSSFANLLSKTLYLFGIGNVLLFICTIAAALRLTRQPESWLNKLVAMLSPLSAIPAWVMGLLIIALMVRLRLFAVVSGEFDRWPTQIEGSITPTVVLITLKFLLLPVAAIVISKFFYSTYVWRNFFLLYEQEPYIELARAKGLKPRTIERRYVLRAALPAVLTSFAILMAGLWQEIILLEVVFRVHGIGQQLALAVEKVESLNSPFLISCVVIFAYLLAITMFVLDLAIVLVDPRVSADTGEGTGSVARAKRRWWLWRRSETRAIAPIGQSFSLSALGEGLKLSLATVSTYLKEIRRSPAALLASAFIGLLAIISVATVILLPYKETVSRWRGDDNVWGNNPRNASPEWINLFVEPDQPLSITLDSHDPAVERTFKVLSPTQKNLTLIFPIDYRYEVPPQAFTIRYAAQYDEKLPFVAMTWITPDGREINLGSVSPPRGDFRLALEEDTQLKARLKTDNVMQGLFADPASADGVALPGQYQLKINAIFFETQDPQLEAQVNFQGTVFGGAGTDIDGRDLMLPLLWGAPVALLFGLIGAVGTALANVLLAAISAWFGGWIDGLIQRLTEITIILPFFPFAVMVFVLYSNTIWVILGVTILLSIFGSSIKTYRAMFLQFKQAPYIEAAVAYGTSAWRIIFVYLIPRISALVISQIMILVPSYVFLEAALATLNVSDPYLPTWGKLIASSFQALIFGDYHKSFATLLLMLTGYAFALIGFTIERHLQRDRSLVG